MKAYQCSKCRNLVDMDVRCACQLGIEPRPSCRELGKADFCRENFELLEEKERWHEEFSWE